MTAYRSGRALRYLQYAAATAVAVLAGVGLLGWAVGDLALAGRVLGYDAMVPTAALSFLLLCAALGLQIRDAVRSRLFVRAAVATVLAIATLELVDLLAGLPVAPDRLFVRATDMSGGRQVGRMSPIVAISLAALAIALLLAASGDARKRASSAGLSVAVASLGFILCIGYAYDTPFLYTTAPLPPALPAAFGLMILGLAVAGVTVDRWPMSLFVGDSVRAQLMRAVFPVIAGTTTVFAALDVADHRFGLTQSPLLTSGIFILAITVVSVTVLRAASGIGGRIDRSDSALKTSNAALERMVHDVATTMGRVVETRDPYTQGHEQRVAALAGLIAREMGMSDDEVDGIEMAGLLHDVGKLGVPAEILTKPGSLSSAEFALIREHPQVGFDILKGIAFPWKIAEAVLQHHERMDGSGYPMGSAGGDILMAARILAVADVVEAMASDRPYRPALGLDLAVKEIAEHPERYDVGVSATCASLYAAGRLAV